MYAPTKVTKVVTGSLLRIIQAYTNCDQNRTWESQPYNGNIPAGNILTSAAILYSGALPATALKMFNIHNVATISQRTFFRHQTQYLQTSVDIVWKRSQELLLKLLKDKGDPLILAGDGRTDSPGHSAKYGSNSVLELTCNKIIDFKLVQVSTIIISMIFKTVHCRVMRLVAVTIWRKVTSVF
jgi:hypothetical protein